MKTCLMKIVLALLLCVCCANWERARAQGQSERAPLSNAAVVKLVRAGFKEKTILAIIRTRPSQFDLSPDQLIELKRNSVSENIILAMLAHEEGAGGPAFENLDDDSFFGGGRNASQGRSSDAGTSEKGTDIFGSAGGSSGRTRSRGGAGGSSAGDSVTSGSATVRILRPPVETGATPRLEKTPTLNNQSIIELVEAGFTEGTIIHRIEQSPADFELTPPKLAELRRRHVSDKIISAMKSAMGDDSTATP